VSKVETFNYIILNKTPYSHLARTPCIK